MFGWLSTLLSQGQKHKYRTGEKHKTHGRAAPSDFVGAIGISHCTQSGVVVVMSTMLFRFCKFVGQILAIGAEGLGTPASLVLSDTPFTN
jgi:hypothetical protein